MDSARPPAKAGVSAADTDRVVLGYRIHGNEKGLRGLEGAALELRRVLPVDLPVS